jgi:hypothetical protein
MAKLIAENAELLMYLEGQLHITVLGGIKLTGLDRLKVTLKITRSGHRENSFRHNLDLYNSMQTEQLIGKSAEALDVPAGEVSRTVNGLVGALEAYRLERLEEMKPKQAEKRELSEAERKQAITFLKSANLLPRTGEAIKLSGLIGEEANGMIAYLTYTSRKRHTPLHLMCLGASGTGKTWLQEKIGELMPEEDKLEITTLSSNAFYYFGREELKHKLLLIEDLDGAESVLYPLRELQSKRKISKTVTLKDNKGNLKTVTLNVEGPVCVSGCTTREKLYEDNANRCILLYMDNSVEQDRKIMDYQRRLSAGQIDGSEEKAVQHQIRNVQRLLKPITVKNPFAPYLQLPEAVFKPRRTMLLLLLFTETVTYYHQYQRVLKTDTDTGEQYIESTVEDIENAFMLLENTILKKSDELNDACRGFFERLKSYLKEKDAESFCSREIRSSLRLSPSSIGRYLYELERMGYIKIIRGNRYKGFEYRVQHWNDMEVLSGEAKKLTESILENIRAVSRIPVVAQSADGLRKVQKTSKKEAVTQGEQKNKAG